MMPYRAGVLPPLKECRHCHIMWRQLRRGMCARCYDYLRKNGVERAPVTMDLRKFGGRWGAASEQFKGDAASPTTKRGRARALYPLSSCERCGGKATERHHIDGDTGNNEPSNIARLCTKCHMTVDGRIAAAAARAALRRGIRTTKPCIECGKQANPLRRGRCNRCRQRKPVAV